jgi:hypothetical protein
MLQTLDGSLGLEFQSCRLITSRGKLLRERSERKVTNFQLRPVGSLKWWVAYQKAKRPFFVGHFVCLGCPLSIKWRADDLNFLKLLPLPTGVEP